MASIKLTNVPPFDGEYPLDLTKFNGDELHLIKQISGVRGGEIREALTAGDYDLVISFAVIALMRAGRTVDAKQIRAADVGCIDVNLDDKESEQRPPASPSSSGSENALDGNGAQNDSTPTSGGPSSSDGDQPPSRPLLTGLPGSATSATSGPETLAS